MSKRMTRYPSDRKVYVGDLGNNARKNDLEYAFSAFGTLRSVWIARNPPGFAFVEFEDARDAADAVRGLDGRTVCGRRARVELSSGKNAGTGRGERRGEHFRGNFGGGGGGGGGGRGAGAGRGEEKCYECGRNGHYARDCKGGGGGRKPRRRSRSRSPSRGHKSYTRSDTRSSSHSHPAAKKPREVYVKSRENGRNENGGATARYSDDERNGDASPPSPRRRYDDSSPSPKHVPSSSSRRRNITLSRSRSLSRRD